MSMRDELSTALGLGLVQGITEFLPISSDGHLALFALLFELREASLATTVLLHVGTLLATLLVFRADLLQMAKTLLANAANPRELFASDDGKLLAAIVVASVPTAAIGLLLEERIEALSRQPWVVGLGFLGSAAAVLTTRGRKDGGLLPGLGTAFLIGLLQGMAVLPGLSRSAMTIGGAMLLGLAPAAAFRFSFLLSMPAVAGAALLELGHPGVLAGMSTAAWIGAVIAFASGCVALRMLRGLLAQGRFWLFAWYLVPLAAAMILWDVL
jgi:undecaprenyl-diphosphatase